MDDILADIQKELDLRQDKINNKLTGSIKTNNSLNSVKDKGASVLEMLPGIAEKGMSAISGGLSMLGNSLNWAKGADLTGYQNQLAEFASHNRGQNFFDNNTLLQSYGSQPDKVKLNADMVNPTAGQSAMHIGGSALSGAMTGLQVAGPWGALIGGVVGLGSGILSDVTKRETNRVNTGIFNYNQDTEEDKNQIAFATGADQARNTQFSQLYKTRMATGGFLRKPSISSTGYRLYHSKCKGGTLVRIKSK